MRPFITNLRGRKAHGYRPQSTADCLSRSEIDDVLFSDIEKHNKSKGMLVGLVNAKFRVVIN